MFESTLRPPSKSRYRHVLAVGSLTLHVAIGAAFLALSFWEIQELRRPSRGIARASSIALPPPGGGGAKAEPKRVEPKPKPKLVRDSHQPKAKHDENTPAETSGSQAGEGASGDGGGEGPGTGPGPGGPGTGLGISLGDLCLDTSDLCAPPPVPVAAPEPTHVPKEVLGTLRRKAGEAQIQPPSATRNAMSRAGVTQATAIMLICLDRSGSVNKTRLVRSSGYPEYDAKLRSGVGRWRYEPYRANGIPAPICTQLTFVYRQQ